MDIKKNILMELGYNKNQIKEINNSINNKSVLTVSGVVGSGMSTTMNRMIEIFEKKELEKKNKRNKKILDKSIKKVNKEKKFKI